MEKQNTKTVCSSQAWWEESLGRPLKWLHETVTCHLQIGCGCVTQFITVTYLTLKLHWILYGLSCGNGNWLIRWYSLLVPHQLSTCSQVRRLLAHYTTAQVLHHQDLELDAASVQARCESGPSLQGEYALLMTLNAVQASMLLNASVTAKHCSLLIISMWSILKQYLELSLCCKYLY